MNVRVLVKASNKDNSVNVEYNTTVCIASTLFENKNLVISERAISKFKNFMKRTDPEVLSELVMFIVS